MTFTTMRKGVVGSFLLYISESERVEYSTSCGGGGEVYSFEPPYPYYISLATTEKKLTLTF